MICDDSRELLIEYSLGQLDASRTQEVREHLSEGCIVCAEKLSQITDTWASFAASLDPVKPSPEVEQKLLAIIRGQVAPPLELPPQRAMDSQLSWVIAYVLAASLVGVATALLTWRLSPLSETPAKREVAAAPLTDWGAPAALPQGVGFQTVAFRPIAEKQGVHFSVVVNGAAEQWHMIGTGLPQTTPGEFYQIWFETKAGKLQRAAKLTADENGRGGVIVDVGAVQQADLGSVWLTLEDSESSQRPSDNILFHAAIK